MYCSTCALLESTIYAAACDRIECVNYSPDVAP